MPGSVHAPAGLLEFAQAVLKANPNADFIKLPWLSRALPCALRHSIMVRQCYRDVVQLIMEVNEGMAGDISTLAGSGFAFVLTGTPGIGKSALAVYLICLLAQQHQKLVYRFVLCMHSSGWWQAVAAVVPVVALPGLCFVTFPLFHRLCACCIAGQRQAGCATACTQ